MSYQVLVSSWVPVYPQYKLSACPSMCLSSKSTLFPVSSTFWLNIIIFLFYVQYNMYHHRHRHPKVHSVYLQKLYLKHTLPVFMISMHALSYGRNYHMWLYSCQSFSKNWPLQFKKQDPNLTPNHINPTLSLTLNYSISPGLYSALTNSPPSTKDYSFDFLMITLQLVYHSSW